MEPGNAGRPSGIVPSVEQLWPGFEPADFPVVVFDGDNTWLYRHPNPPDEFLQGPTKDGAIGFLGRHPAVVGNTAAEIGGEITATILHGEGPDTEALIAHETFHVYCRRQHPRWVANEAVAMEYPDDDVDALTLRRLEARALRQAILDCSREWAATAMTVRRQRFAQLPEAAARYERDLELCEGLAHYVEGRAAGRVRCIDALSEPSAPDAIRASSYSTGEAIAVLLDRFRPGWTDILEANDTLDLDGLLCGALAATHPRNFHAEERMRVADGAREDIAAMKAERRARREAFLARKDAVVLTAPDDEPFTVTGFDPMNIVNLGDGEVLHTRWIKLRGHDGDIEMLNGQALTEAAGSHALFDGIARVTLVKNDAE